MPERIARSLCRSQDQLTPVFITPDLQSTSNWSRDQYPISIWLYPARSMGISIDLYFSSAPFQEPYNLASYKLIAGTHRSPILIPDPIANQQCQTVFGYHAPLDNWIRDQQGRLLAPNLIFIQTKFVQIFSPKRASVLVLLH